MIETPSYLTSQGEQIPIWCDIYVLNAIQEKYGRISEFEKKLLGMAKEGPQPTETDMAAVMWVLPLLIREGHKKQAADRGELPTAINEYQIISGLDGTIPEIVIAIYKEYRRCFVTSKK